MIIDAVNKCEPAHFDQSLRDGLAARTNPRLKLSRGSVISWNSLDSDSADEYRIHIQIAELNALNAALAVIKFKQIRGFYFDKDMLKIC